MRSGIQGIIMPMRQLSIKDEMIMNDVVAPSTMRHFLQDYTHESKNSWQRKLLYYNACNESEYEFLTCFNTYHAYAANVIAELSPFFVIFKTISNHGKCHFNHTLSLTCVFCKYPFRF